MQAIGTRQLETPADFSRLVEKVQSDPDYREPEAFALGLARIAVSGEVLDVRFPSVNRNENHGTAAVLAGATGNFESVYDHGVFINPESVDRQISAAFAPFENDGKPHPNIAATKAIFAATSKAPERYTVKPVLATVFDLDSVPKNEVDAWFRLNLLSTRKVKPHGVNLEGVFGLMTNVAWTSEGPILPEDVDKVRTELLVQDRDLIVRGVDRFPHMLDYVRPPSGVRVADATRVRLGAHLGEGTTVMHEGFVNFNAGTLGKAMIEGRISAGVVVGDRTDIGGSASIMGTLSGGGKTVISVGEDCLLGANSGIGISLGNDCVVEAGLYVTAGTKVSFEGAEVRAIDLSGSSGLLFIRHSLTGVVTAMRREGKKIELNPVLHRN